jgi:NAD(P) transhydrogenase subunit beta
MGSSFITDPDTREALGILAVVLIVVGLSGLAGPRTAVRGNRLAAAGLGVAVLATLLVPDIRNIGLILLGVAIGTAVGIPAARRVRMTQMPQMVALFNGLGGGAVALIALVEFRTSDGFADVATSTALFTAAAAVIGSLSFWGSLIAFGKLQGLLSGRPIGVGRLRVPATALLAAGAVGLAAASVATGSRAAFLLTLAASAVLGPLLVLPIGGADMPVVISGLNALTGLSAAATGVALENTPLIVAGMVVGASGTLLTRKMAEAMNRPVLAVFAGGFGGGEAPAAVAGGTVRATTAADVAIQLAYADLVVIVPGYGMAVSQAQHAVRDLSTLMSAQGVAVEYAIHPVAGRMPGQMNVLLAEADVPYEELKELDEANADLHRADVALVIGANDVVNPDARSNPASPIYGMPILDVDRARAAVVLKRSMRAGYAGIDNPLFTCPRTTMLFGDAKASLTAIADELRALGVATPSAAGASARP